MKGGRPLSKKDKYKSNWIDFPPQRREDEHYPLPIYTIKKTEKTEDCTFLLVEHPEADYLVIYLDRDWDNIWLGKEKGFLEDDIVKGILATGKFPGVETKVMFRMTNPDGGELYTAFRVPIRNIKGKLLKEKKNNLLEFVRALKKATDKDFVFM